jgi:hypothetical protein
MAFREGSINDSLIGTFPINPFSASEYIRQFNPNLPNNITQLYVYFQNDFDIRSDYMIAQSLLETDFYRFTGQVPITFFNPAGLRDETGQFAQFPDWECGIKAHYERMSDYVFPNGIISTCDPNPGNWRYQQLLNENKNPEQLIAISSLWQDSEPAIQYANEILNIRNELVLFNDNIIPESPLPGFNISSNLPLIIIGATSILGTLLLSN